MTTEAHHDLIAYCECGTQVAAGSERELVEAVQRHLAEVHGGEVSREVVQPGSEIIDALRRGERPLPPTPQRPEVDRSLSEPELIGREAELRELGRLLDQARAGRGTLAVIGAESGGGKTTLLDAFAAGAEAEGVWLLWGQGRHLSAESPYQVLDGVITELARRSAGDAEFRARMQRQLAEDAAELTAAMPQLAGLFGRARTELPGSTTGHRQRTVQVLQSLLAMLGTRERPAVVVLDDCQWADESTLELLREWQHSRSEQPRYVLVLTAFRTDGAGESDPLFEAPVHQIRLERLHAGQIEQLVASMAGPVPPEAADLVAQLCAGNPFLATEAVRAFVERDLLVADAAAWRLQSDRLAEAQSSDRAAAVVGERIEQLPVSVLEILSAAAVLGKQFSASDVADLADRPVTEVLAALTEARRRHIVWLEFDGGQWAFLHDQLRDTLHARLSDETQHTLHARVAEQIESDRPAAVFELAYHYDAAGEHRRALPHALAAAREAQQRYALEVAQHHYAIALAAVAEGDHRLRLEIVAGLGEVELLRGRYDEAQEHFGAALGMTEDSFTRAQIEGKLAELAFKRGDVGPASKQIEQALRSLGEPVPRTRAGFVARLVCEVIVQFAHSVLPSRFLARRSPDDSARDLLAARLLSELAHAYWFTHGRVPCGWAHLREMNLAERYPPTVELAQAYSEHAPVTTMVPWFSRGLAYAQRSLEIRRELGDRWGEAQSQHYYAVVLYGAGRVREALELLEEAIKILERGDKWEVSNTKWHIAACQYRLGQMAEAAATAQEVYDDAVQIGDVQAAGIGLGYWAKATSGRVPPENLQTALAAESVDVHTTAEVLQAQTLAQLAAGDPRGAVAAIEQADKLVRQSGLRQEYIAPVPAWLATALRTVLMSDPELSKEHRGQIERSARRAARRAARIARSYPNSAPHALREQGLLAAYAGNHRRARKFLDRSLQAAERLDAAAEYAETLAARGAVAEALGWAGCDGQMAEGSRMIDAILPDDPRADRFAIVRNALTSATAPTRSAAG